MPTRSVLCLLFCVLVSCDFEPGGEIFTTVPEATTDALTIDLENYPNENIELRGKTIFRYSVEPQDKQLIETRALFDGTIVWTTKQRDGSFQLDPAEMETGSYKLRIEFAVASGTGSLADKLGAEFIYVWTERTVLVDNQVPQDANDPNAIFITSVENVDYSIKVNWSQYMPFNFEKYEVIRRDYDQFGYVRTERTIPAMSTDQAHTYLFDRMYVGGPSEYFIKVYAAGKTYTSPPVSYEYPYVPGIRYEIKPDGNVTIRWTSLSALKNNFRSYQLEISDDLGYTIDRVTFSLHSVTDTTVTFIPANFRFGKLKPLKLIIYPAVDNINYTTTHIATLKYGDPFPPFDPSYTPIRFNADTQRFYCLSSGKLIAADGNGKALDTLSSSGDVKINNTVGIQSDDGVTYRINLATMERGARTALPRGAVLDVSDDNKVLFYSNAGKKIFTLDGVELYSFGSGIRPYYGISPDGQYVLTQPYIHRFNGTSFEQWTSYSTNVLTASFPSQEPGKVIFGETDRVRKFNIETKSEELSAMAYTGPCNLDPVTNKLGCLTGDQFVILNADDLQVYKSLPVQADAGHFYLLNGKVICSSGAQIELSDIP